MARPTKFDSQKMELICKAMEIGATRRIAAHAAGVHVATLYAWLAKGREAATGPFREFYDAFQKAEAMCALRDLSLITRAAETSWQAAAWRLERRHPSGYGRSIEKEEDISLTASELDIATLIKELKETNEIVSKFTGPTIDVNEA